MKRLLSVLTVMSGIIGFMGAGYVPFTGGRVNAGYAVIPMPLSITRTGGYVLLKKGKQGLR